MHFSLINPKTTWPNPLPANSSPFINNFCFEKYLWHSETIVLKDKLMKNGYRANANAIKTKIQ
jgi:hypothetical protein